MSDIFDFAIDFGLTYFEPPTKKKQLSMKEYRTGYVDYYDQTLDPTLGTGIDAPEGDDDDDKEDERRDVNISRIGTGATGGSDDSSTPSPLELSSANVYNLKTVPTYGQSLSAAGFDDKTPFNVFGTDVYLGGVPRTKEEAKKGLENLISKESLFKTGVKTAGRMFGMNPFITGGVAGFATGRTVKDPFGNASFRPSHAILGGVHDLNMSIQYDDVAKMHAALGTTGPKGFATYIGGQLVTRAPGSFNYNGTGAIGVDREVLNRIDAISKGFVPSSFNYKTEQGESGTRIDATNGMYDERGRYHDAYGTYAMGSRKASTSFGKQYGLSTTKVEQILADVRADKEKKLSEEIQKAQREQVEQRIQDTGTTVTDIPDSYGVQDDIYSGFGTVSVDTSDDDGGSYDAGSDSSDMGFSTRYGGQIGEGMQEGGPAGFIGGPPEKYSKQTTIADDIPLEVKEGTFVINAPAVEYAGSDDIANMLREAYEKAGESIDKSGQRTTIPSREQIDIMISRGEVVVPPKIAKIIGYDRLEKINNRGKKEVARRKKAGDQEKPQARQANEGGVMTLDDIKYKEFYSSPEKARAETEKILRSLPLPDALAIMMYEEANVLGDKGLEGVAHVFVNRADAEGYKDFGNSLIDELTKRTYTEDKIFQFNALEPTKFRRTLKRLKKDEGTYLKIRNIAEEVIAGAREDFTKGALFFKNPKSAQAKDFKKMVDSGEYEETARSKKVKGVFQHIYYRPRDVGFVTQKAPDIESNEIPEGFVEIPKPVEQARPRIPESRGGSFLFRGSDYERGGATPAF
tara:strand:- start:41 stop:2440 length:2400 start_codon:yes stop_codon:yes gene_type:complete